MYVGFVQVLVNVTVVVHSNSHERGRNSVSGFGKAPTRTQSPCREKTTQKGLSGPAQPPKGDAEVSFVGDDGLNLLPVRMESARKVETNTLATLGAATAVTNESQKIVSKHPLTCCRAVNAPAFPSPSASEIASKVSIIPSASVFTAIPRVSRVTNRTASRVLFSLLFRVSSVSKSVVFLSSPLTCFAPTLCAATANTVRYTSITSSTNTAHAAVTHSCNPAARHKTQTAHARTPLVRFKVSR